MDRIVDGNTAAPEALGKLAGLEYGIWEMMPGTDHDIEADEVFVVLAGDATVTFAGGEEIVLAPGSVVRLGAGEQTTWVVRETLRKVYVTPA